MVYSGLTSQRYFNPDKIISASPDKQDGALTKLFSARKVQKITFNLLYNSVFRGDNHVTSSPFPHVQSDLNESIQQRQIESNRREYGYQYDLLNFAGPEQLAAATEERKELLQWLDQRASSGYAGTKLDCNGLSPGCRSCGDGGWSCLFVNGRCNARCFYCPTAQDDDGPPLTNGLAFTSPED